MRRENKKKNKNKFSLNKVIIPNFIRLLTSNINNNKLTSYQRIGPHNFDLISIIIGSTLALRKYSSLNSKNSSRLSKLEQDKFIINSELKEILIGLCLGDLFIGRKFPN